MLPKILALAAALSSPSVLALVSAPPQKSLLPARADIPGFKLDPSSGVHFLDCQPREEALLSARQAGAPEPSWLSILVYCANNTDCLDPSHNPLPSDVCVKQTSTTPRNWTKWENESDWKYCRFAERGWFSWVISRFGRLFPPGDECGYAEDDAKSPFDGFRGDEMQGAGPETHICSRVYYFTASQGEAEASVDRIPGGLWR
ncbi:hypothetical protein QBC39DRAFT_358736 [Podospora conica]|nr:hypothetical protein QBC39DRAFT_358736 [Schizothecium conicum]